MIKKYAVFAILTFATLSLAFLNSAFAQSKKFEDVLLWHVAYVITVKGEYAKVEADSSAETWSIDRKYSGFLTLDNKIMVPKFEIPDMVAGMMTAEQMREYQKTMAVIGTVRWDNATQGGDGLTRDAHVYINDKSKSVVHSPGEGGTWMNIVTEQSWFCDSQAKAMKFSHFLADTKNMTFTIQIPFDSLNGEKIVKHQSEVKNVNSGTFSYEPPKKTDENVSLNQRPIPNITGMIEGGSITYKSPEGSLNTDFDTWDFTTPEMQPDTTVMQLPGSKTNLKVKIYFKFSKTNLGNKIG